MPRAAERRIRLSGASDSLAVRNRQEGSTLVSSAASGLSRPPAWEVRPRPTSPNLLVLLGDTLRDTLGTSFIPLPETCGCNEAGSQEEAGISALGI